MAEPIDIPFWLWTRVGPRNHLLDVGPYRPSEGAIFKVKYMSGHARRHSALPLMGILNPNLPTVGEMLSAGGNVRLGTRYL